MSAASISPNSRVVLEPEEPLRTARRAFYAGMAALIDALAATAQPETSLQVDGRTRSMSTCGLVGGGRSPWPEGAGEDDDSALAGVRRHDPHRVDGRRGAGRNPLITALDEEGFADTLSSHLVESFARNLMVAVDAWHESGFGAVAKTYLERLPREKDVRRDIDDNGDLLIRRMAKAKIERRELLPLLKQPSWLDPASKGPRA